MPIPGKIYNKTLLNWIQPHIDPLLCKKQEGFRPGRSCAQQINILRRIMEGFREHQLPLIIIVVDLKKALDSIQRSVMFAILRLYGILETLLYNISTSAVMIDGSISSPFSCNNRSASGTLFLFHLAILHVAI